jgi:hypothetical protein
MRESAGRKMARKKTMKKETEAKEMTKTGENKKVIESAPEKAKEDVFVPEVMNVKGVDHKVLTEVDLLTLELLHSQIRAVAASSRLMSVEADQLEMKTVMKIRKMRQDANDLAQEHIELNDKKKRLINKLSEKYGVNFSNPNTSYDTETRVISVVEEPFNRAKQKAEAGKADA